VRGAVCPTPLGSYRYRKRKGSGASLMADVEVFPLAVSEELPSGRKGRARAPLVLLSEAADAVEEPDVCLVPTPAAQDRRLLRTVRGACDVAITAAADAMGRLVQGGPAMHENPRDHEREHDADEIIREVLTTVRRTFLTPFDRGAITSLIGAMDDAIDEMQAAARRSTSTRCRSFGQR
jgi:hypothetical protein